MAGPPWSLFICPTKNFSDLDALYNKDAGRWYGWQDSNLRQLDYQSSLLPTEVHPHKEGGFCQLPTVFNTDKILTCISFNKNPCLPNFVRFYHSRIVSVGLLQFYFLVWATREDNQGNYRPPHGGVFWLEVSANYPAISEQPPDKNQVCPSLRRRLSFGPADGT